MTKNDDRAKGLEDIIDSKLDVLDMQRKMLGERLFLDVHRKLLTWWGSILAGATTILGFLAILGFNDFVAGRAEKAVEPYIGRIEEAILEASVAGTVSQKELERVNAALIDTAKSLSDLESQTRALQDLANARKLFDR
ncbi:MAG: hypothetical protein R3D59_15150 [Paracoccaceae bacterium]